MNYEQIKDLVFSNAKPPKKNDRFFPDNTFRKDFEVPKIERTVKPVGDDLPDILLAMEKCVVDDKLRPAMNYVFSDGKALVATDAHKLVWLNRPEKAGYYHLSSMVKGNASERTFNKDIPEIRMGDMVEVDAKQILWESVVPKREGVDKTKLVFLKDLYSICLGAKRFNDFVGTPTKMHIKIEDGFFAYDILMDAVLTMLKLGETDIELQYNGPSKALCLWGDEANALIMPCLNDNGELFYTEFKI